MEIKADNSISYIDTFESLKWAILQKYDLLSENEQLEIMNITYGFIYNTINNILLINKNNDKEEYIRMLCRFTIKNILPRINKKIYEYNNKRSQNEKGSLNNNEMIKLNNWLDLEDNFYAIASMRSLYHLALYLERDDAESQKVWCYIIDDVMGGIFYTANQMILNNKYQNLIKQCPTGYGKCCSEDTMVFSKKGYVKISELNVGDYVYSMENNKLVENKITNIWHSSKKQVKIYTRSGANIIVSPEHRMYTQRGYVEAKNITCNDYLYELCSKDFVWNKIISIEYDDTEIPMIDIEVQNTHNFIANNLVSHNSKSDCVIICYILGYDHNATIMKVVGNPKLVGEITQNITKMLLSPRFGKVFKEFGDCKGKENEMFTTIKQTDGTFKLKWSKQARSFLCVNKDTAIDGTRYDYQFYDDVTQSKDKENVTQHMKDRSNYTSQWKKRASNEFTTKRFFTGTAYHREDFLSYIKSYQSNNVPLVKELELTKFKWSKFVKFSQDRKTAYIIVPKLANLEFGEEKSYCTFPQRFSKKEALDMYHGNLGSRREFFAMEQQTPLPPEKLCFDYAYLNQYEKLPEDIIKRQSLSKMIIDPSRKGYDNFSALIFEKSSLENKNKWYFTSCFYEQVSSKAAIPEVVKLIIDHKCTTIYVETNIDITDSLENELQRNKYYDYEIVPFYSYEKKDEKISNTRDDIRDNIIFPIEGMYHFDSPMGRAMSDIVNYSMEGKNKHDDSIDCCAMFMIQESEESSNTIEFLPINIKF